MGSDKDVVSKETLNEEEVEGKQSIILLPCKRYPHQECDQIRSSSNKKEKKETNKKNTKSQSIKGPTQIDIIEEGEDDENQEEDEVEQGNNQLCSTPTRKLVQKENTNSSN